MNPPVDPAVTSLAALTTTVRPCPLCGGGVLLRLDKAGRPYVRCPFCGSTVFMKSYVALAGWLIGSARVANDHEGWRAAIEAGQAQLMGQQPTPAPAVRMPPPPPTEAVLQEAHVP
jgi:DNA-directed RNA polymerase subunit RPC12/RpoP